jgi:putative aminopeptidase FrvX
MDPLALLQEFVSIPGPAGQEERIRGAVERHANDLGYETATDAKGNLLAWTDGATEFPKAVVTAHLDEIAMIVTRVEHDATLSVKSLGGLFPWKLGEGPVTILATGGDLPGVLSFGSIHTADAGSVVRQADSGPLKWEMAHVFTGLSVIELVRSGVRPGTRVVVSPQRRQLTKLGDHVAGYFLDDRADLVAMLLAMRELKTANLDVLFAATAAEEVGGEGALYLLQEIRPEICVALELGPSVPDAPVMLDANPTVWATDSYSTPAAADLDLIAEVGESLGMHLQFQALSRGGSDASCAASHGHCARPITLGLPMENTHGYEIMHRNAPAELARLTAALLKKLLAV